jgi:hypothetical protein
MSLFIECIISIYGDVVELVDTCDSNSHAERRNGSSPFIPTKLKKLKVYLIGYNSLNI